MPSVFNRTIPFAAPAAAADPSRLIVPGNLQGQTQHFAVYLDPALGADGKQDAQGVLRSCEADYAKVAGYFGGLAAGPFNVVLFANPGGAFHQTCAATDLFCDARTNPGDGRVPEGAGRLCNGRQLARLEPAELCRPQ